MLIVQFDQTRDVQPLRAVIHAVMACGARHGFLAGQLRRHLHQRLHLILLQRQVGLKCGNVGVQLRFVGHAGKDHLDLRQALQEAEGPRRDFLVRTQRFQHLFLLLAQSGQLAAAKRLHDPDGNAVFLQQLDLFLAVLEFPVQIVQLQLTEFHLIAVGFQEPLQHRQFPMGGKAKILDAARLLLREEMLHDAVLGIEILFDVQLADIVQQVEVKELQPCALQLRREDLLHFRHVCQIISRELVREVIAVSGVFAQGLPHDLLGMFAVVAPRRVVIIDAVFHSVVHHALGLRDIHLRVIAVDDRQTHRAKTQLR